MGTRRRYDEEARTRAVALAVEVGPAEAARQLGIRAGTIASWMHRAGVASVAPEQTRAAVEMNQANAEARRAALAEKMLLIAEKAAVQELKMLENAKLRDVVGARTRAIHDHQLLTGAATGRTEHTAGKEAAHAVADELKARRDKKAA